MCPPCVLITADHIRLMDPMALAWKSCKMTIHTYMRSLLSCSRFIQNSEFYLTTLRTHRRGHRFINASRFSNGWYWSKAGDYSLAKLTKKYNHQCLNKEMMPYLVSVMLPGVPLRHRAALLASEGCWYKWRNQHSISPHTCPTLSPRWKRL